jgi:hypothetical protein
VASTEPLPAGQESNPCRARNTSARKNGAPHAQNGRRYDASDIIQLSTTISMLFDPRRDVLPEHAELTSQLMGDPPPGRRELLARANRQP